MMVLWNRHRAHDENQRRQQKFSNLAALVLPGSSHQNTGLLSFSMHYP